MGRYTIAPVYSRYSEVILLAEPCRVCGDVNDTVEVQGAYVDLVWHELATDCNIPGHTVFTACAQFSAP